MKSEFGITFGALCPKISEQVVSQDLKIAKAAAAVVQADADAISRLLIRGIITDSEARRARQRLISRIGKMLA